MIQSYRVLRLCSALAFRQWVDLLVPPGELEEDSRILLNGPIVYLGP